VRDWAKRINWLWAAGGFTLVYLVGAALIVGPVRAWTFLTTGDLNEVGDFLAGVFSPLAFIWLVAAVLTQRQELDDTRHQFAEGQKVIDGQMKNIAAQNLTSALQYEKAQEAAKQTYKLNLFEQRFTIYNDLLTIHKELESKELSVDHWKRLVTIAERSAFLFPDKVYGYIQNVSEMCIEHFIYLDENKTSWHVDPNEGGGPPMEERHVAVRNTAMSQKFGLVASISETSLKEVMWNSMRVSDE